MVGNKKKTVTILIIIAVVAASAIGAFIYLSANGESGKREKNPESYVIAAIRSTYSDFKIPSYDSDWIFDILEGKHQIDFEFGINDLDIANLPIDPQLSSMLQLAKLEAIVKRDNAEEKAAANVGIAAGGMRVIDFDVYASNQELAVKIPNLFDYFITADPKNSVTQWEKSPLGLVAKPSQFTNDNMFYEVYRKIFTKIAQPAKLLFANNKPLLLEDAEYEFIGGKDEVYDYVLTVKAEKFNKWYQLTAADIESQERFKNFDLSAIRNFSVADDLKFNLHVESEKIKEVNLLTALPGGIACSGNLTLLGETNVFDAVAADIYFENPNNVTASPKEEPDISDALLPYIMLEQMPPKLRVFFSHKGGGQALDLFASVGELAFSTIEEGTERDKTSLAWDYSWSKDEIDNFKLNVNAASKIGEKSAAGKISVLGNVLENKEKNMFFSSFNNVKLSYTDFNENDNSLAFNMKCNFSSFDEPVDFDKTSATQIDKLSTLQLIRIYGNLSKDPVLGNLIKVQ